MPVVTNLKHDYQVLIIFDGCGEDNKLFLNDEETIEPKDFWQPLLPKKHQEKFEQPKIFLISVIFYFMP